MSKTEAASTPAAVPLGRRYANGWPVIPMRVFLAALFAFAGYAKLSYPRFFDPNSPSGLKASVDAVKHGTPIGSVLGPLSDHPSVYGHITAYAEIAIGLGLLVGLLTRIAALGGMVLTALIVLSIDWGGVKEYTGSSGWYTSVDLAVAAALSVFLLGGAGPLSLDALYLYRRNKRRARDDADPSFRDSELEDSRRRLQGEDDRTPVQAEQPDQPTQQIPVQSGTAPYAAAQPGATRPAQSEPATGSLWNTGRREPVDPSDEAFPTEVRRD